MSSNYNRRLILDKRNLDVTELEGKSALFLPATEHLPIYESVDASAKIRYLYTLWANSVLQFQLLTTNTRVVIGKDFMALLLQVSGFVKIV